MPQMFSIDMSLGFGGRGSSAPAEAGGPAIGDELVTNGGFDSGANWALLNATIALGACTFDAGGFISGLLNVSSLSPGTYHFVCDDVNGWGGSFEVSIGGETTTATSDGTHVTCDIVLASSAAFPSVGISDTASANGPDMPIDNVSVKRTA